MESVEIHEFYSWTYERFECANRRMRIETSSYRKTKFYKMEAETF